LSSGGYSDEAKHKVKELSSRAVKDAVGKLELLQREANNP